MSKSRGINAPRAVWTEPMLALLKLHYPDRTAKALAADLGVGVSVVYQKANVLGLQKSAAFNAGATSGRLRGDEGACTRFKPGNTPWTLGMKGVHLSPASEFKKGSVPANCLEVSALRINSLGELDMKIAPGPGNWVSMRRFAWEQAYGPIQPGMCVLPKNGDGHDTRLCNLKLVTRAENIQINLLSKYPKELRLTMQLRGKLASQISKSQEACHG